MQPNDLVKLSRPFLRTLQRNSPTILTGLAVTGFVTTVFMAIKATPKAVYLLEELREHTLEQMDEEPKILDKAQVLWKPYLPAALMGATTIICIVGANHINLRRNAALLSLYSLADVTLKEYQKKVVDTIGRSKEDHIRADLAQDQMDRHPIDQKTIIVTNKGTQLFFDGISGRYFYSDIQLMKKIQNDLNHRLLTDMYITLNDLYFEMGLEGIMLGNDMGWEVNNMLEFRFDSRITPDEKSCIVLNHLVRPTVLK